MYDEFMKLAGYQVSRFDYDNIIEPMYMALPDNITKREFIAMLDKKRFALPTKADYVRKLRKIGQHLYEIWGHSCDYKAENELNDLIRKMLLSIYGIDWYNDMGAYYTLIEEYEYPDLARGCTVPVAVRFGKDGVQYGYIVIIPELYKQNPERYQ